MSTVQSGLVSCSRPISGSLVVAVVVVVVVLAEGSILILISKFS